MSLAVTKMFNECIEKEKLSANITKHSHENIIQKNQFDMLHINVTTIQVYATTPRVVPT